MENLTKEKTFNPNPIKEKFEFMQQCGADAAPLLPFLSSDDWLLRAKALVEIGRTQDISTAELLFDGVLHEEKPWWQLQFLDAWWHLPLSNDEKLASLAGLLQEDNQPVVLRGAIWCVGRLSGMSAIDIFVNFIAQPFSRVVRDEILADCWFRLAKTVDQQELQEYVNQNADLNSWLLYRDPQEDTNYGIYPGHDYLWQIAEDLGVTQKDFKRIYFRARTKKSKPANV